MNQTEILELKNVMNEMKNEIKTICSRVKQVEDKVSELEDRNFEITQLKENKIEESKRMKKACVIYRTSLKEQILE